MIDSDTEPVVEFEEDPDLDTRLDIDILVETEGDAVPCAEIDRRTVADTLRDSVTLEVSDVVSEGDPLEVKDANEAD